ncbi:unnamed protein product [Jaminaea pallidilutea]
MKEPFQNVLMSSVHIKVAEPDSNTRWYIRTFHTPLSSKFALARWLDYQRLPPVPPLDAKQRPPYRHKDGKPINK